MSTAKVSARGGETALHRAGRGFIVSPAMLRRLLWAVLLTIHLPVLLKSWQLAFVKPPGELQLVGTLWLTLAVAFFVLKLCDVTWLRFRTDRRSLAVILIAVLLMHGDSLGLAGVPGDIPLLSTMLLVFGLDRVQAFLRAKGAAAHRATGCGRPGWQRTATALVRRALCWAAVVRAPRAPPVCS